MQFLWVPIGVMMGLLVAIAYLCHTFFMWEMPAEIQRVFISQERQDTRLENQWRTATAVGAVFPVFLAYKIYQRRQDAKEAQDYDSESYCGGVRIGFQKNIT